MDNSNPFDGLFDSPKKTENKPEILMQVAMLAADLINRCDRILEAQKKSA